MQKTDPRTFSRVMHGFWFEVTNGDGTKTKHQVFAKIRLAKKPVDLVVTKEHILQALRQNGVGNSSKCAMAVCCYAQKDAFPHTVEGHVDWTRSRAYVVTKTKFGLPSECVGYEHKDMVARDFDSPAGLKRLLKKVERHGSITVRLLPYHDREEDRARARKGSHKVTTGVRKHHGRNAKARFDLVHLGIGNAKPETDAA